MQKDFHTTHSRLSRSIGILFTIVIVCGVCCCFGIIFLILRVPNLSLNQVHFQSLNLHSTEVKEIRLDNSGYTLLINAKFDTLGDHENYTAATLSLVSDKGEVHKLNEGANAYYHPGFAVLTMKGKSYFLYKEDISLNNGEDFQAAPLEFTMYALEDKPRLVNLSPSEDPNDTYHSTTSCYEPDLIGNELVFYKLNYALTEGNPSCSAGDRIDELIIGRGHLDQFHVPLAK